LGDGSRPKSISGSGRCGCGNRPDFKKLKISLDFFVSIAPPGSFAKTAHWALSLRSALVDAKKRREKEIEL
jgi:hypothetical protein